MVEIMTIGHSTLSVEVFLKRLADAGVSMLVDVRSTPHSRFQPHFSYNPLRNALSEHFIEYVYLGDELGGRPFHQHLYTENKADYEKMAKELSFQSAIDDLITRSAVDNIVVMCSEGNPVECHRCLLLGRALCEKGCHVKHLLTDGKHTTQSEIEQILLGLAGKAILKGSIPIEDQLTFAYKAQSKRVAYKGTRI